MEVREDRAEDAAKADSANAPNADQVSGTVTAVDAGARTVSVREELSSSPTQPFRSPTQLIVDAGAKVEHAGQRLALSDVQAGDHVILQIRDSAGQRMVTGILIMQRAGAAAR